jgi:hypothetical protein
MTVAELLAKHGIKLASTAPGRHYTTCPKCSGDRSNANQKKEVLGVTIEADGSVRWGCNHCDFKGGGKPREGETGKSQTYYDYRDADGVLQFQKVRNPPGSAARFYCRRPDGNGRWINSLKGIDHKPLYRWPEILKAMKDAREIAIVEGEKDADNLWALDIPATCNFDGAADVLKNQKVKPKWKAEYSEALRGAAIVVIPDHDPPGYAHADATCKTSFGICTRVRRLVLCEHWPEIPKGGDVSDWLAAGHTREELQALIEGAPDHAAPEQKQEQQEPKEEPTNGTDAEITRLAQLSTVEYEQQRKGAAEKLDMRASILDKLVEAERLKLNPDADDGKQGHAIAFPEPEPWPDPVEGPALLNGIAAAIRRHVVMPRHATHACALWVVHTYLTQRFLISPRLGIRSPMKGCGKTLLLDVLGRLVLRPLSTANVSVAAIFRVIEAHRPCLLIDEADTFLYDNDELRGVLNGNRKGSTVLRTVGDDHEPRAFATYSACAIAMIGALPDTLHDRAVTIDLQRRRPRERIQPFRPDRADHLDVLARMAVRWAKDHGDRIAERDPEMPAGVINRPADNWRALLAIADEAGGRWGQRARKAAEAAHGTEADEGSRLELLLADIRAISRGKMSMPSADLVKALVVLEGRPWAELGKSRKPLTQNRLASMFKPLKIRSEDIWVGSSDGKALKGYVFEHFKEAFARYLPPEGVSEPRGREDADEMGTSEPFQTARSETDLADRKCEKSNNGGHPRGLADQKGGSGGKADLQIVGVRSDDLPYTGPVVEVPDQGPDPLDEHGIPLPATNGGVEPGLSQRTISELAEDYTERAYANAQENGGDTRTAELDAALRQRLADDGVPPEFVEVEFARIMSVVFRV